MKIIKKLNVSSDEELNSDEECRSSEKEEKDKVRFEEQEKQN